MAEQIYLTEVTEIGVEVPDFLETGLMILFEASLAQQIAALSGTGSQCWTRQPGQERANLGCWGSDRCCSESGEHDDGLRQHVYHEVTGWSRLR